MNTFACKSQWLNIYPESGLFGLDALNKDSVFVVGKDKILKSTDGGLNWINVLNQSFDAYSVVFPNNNIGYVSGINKILKSTNGGYNWSTIRSTNSWYRKISFINQDSGLVLVSDIPDTILRTLNGGQNWYPVFCRSHIKEVNSFNDNTIYLLSDSIFKSVDFGNTWNYIPLDTLFDPVFNVITTCTFLTSNIGIVRLQDGNYLKTINGGLTWTYLGLDLLPPFDWCYFYSLTPIKFYYYGWDDIAGYGSINYSDDGGSSWISQKSGYFNCLSFANDSIGYSVDLNNGIYKTTDGGLAGFQYLEQNDGCVLNVYPNPVQTTLFINGNVLNNTLLTIYNTNTQIIYQAELEVNILNYISISGFANGIYFYSVMSNSKIYQVGKFIKTF